MLSLGLSKLHESDSIFLVDKKSINSLLSVQSMYGNVKKKSYVNGEFDILNSHIIPIGHSQGKFHLSEKKGVKFHLFKHFREAEKHFQKIGMIIIYSKQDCTIQATKAI